MGEEGAGIDVASPYEAEAALAAGIPADRLDLNGNAKDDGLIRLAIEKDMLIVIDSVEELERTATLAHEQQRAPRALLRVSGFDLGPVTASAIFTAGVWTKFGIAINEVPALLPRLAEMPVRVLGFHTHIGSQITDVAAYSAVLGKLLELGALLKQAGHDFAMVNIGGGYPVSYVSKEEWDRIVARIRDGYPIVRATDGTVVESTDLWNATLQAAVDPVTAGVWSGTIPDGTSHTDNCDDWTSSDSGTFARRGITTGTSNGWWLSNMSEGCYSTRRLYCIEQ